MAKVKITGHASGSGIVTVSAPDTDSDRTITLPDATGTLALTTGDDDKLPLAGGAMTGAITTNSTFDTRDVATDGTKLDGIEANADVTDTLNVTSAGALMDSEVTNLAEVKAFAAADYATAAQGTTADAALPKAGGTMTGALLTGAQNFGGDATDYLKFTDNAQLDVYVNGSNEFRFEADGDFHADADVIAYSTTVSDATLKYNINPVEFALDKIKQLKGVTFNYFKGDKESAGLLAQDVEKVMPCAVAEKKLPLHTGDDKAYKTLHYDSVTAILVEAIKELTVKVEKLENK